jgi:uncharacterized protein
LRSRAESLFLRRYSAGLPFFKAAHLIAAFISWRELFLAANSRRFFYLNLFLLVVALPPFAQTAAQTLPLEGTYAGTLQAGEAQLHLVLHLTKSADAALRATLDSLDQGVYAIEATHVSLTGSTLKIEVGSVGATFVGAIAPDHKTINGEWSQGSASLALIFARQANSKPSANVFPVEGIWQSALETQGLRLRFQLHISHDTQDKLVAALDSLDQGVSGLPAVNISLNESAIHFEIPAVAGVYDGTLSVRRNTLSGKWTQTGVDNQALNFKRSDQPLALRRPQNPVKPYPYREEEVSFTNGAAKVTLAGTLTLPKGKEPFPAIILIAGSGPLDRDGFIADHRPLLVLADYLARKGFVVLRYDKRGVGKSSGAADTATTLDLAADASAAIEFLKSRKDVDPAKIGLIGHSEGALIAPYLATHSNKDLAWLVLLAPPATVGEETLLHQSELIGRVGGLSDTQLESSLSFDHAAYDLVRAESDPSALAGKIAQLVKDSQMDVVLPPAAIETQLRMLSSPWFRFFLDYDPLPVLQTLETPTLALYGQKDLQVPAKLNLPLIRKALQDGGNPDSDARELPGLNHLFQTAYSGSPAEYQAIEETFSPAALQTISDWLLVRAKRK